MLFHFDLPAQSLAETLRAIGSTTNTDIGFADNQVVGLVAPALRADLTIDAALARVLAGTGFRPRHLNGHTIVIAAMGSPVSETVHGKVKSPNNADSILQAPDTLPIRRNAPSSFPTLLASADSPKFMSDKPVDEDDENPKKLEDVVVTGSHLRGVTDTGSSVQVITGEDIQKAGFGTVTELVQSIPQAFGGQENENTTASILGGSGDNVAGGTGIDLRGLGATSTLVLVNGRRLAPSNGQFDGYTDVSSIPLAAIERVEIVADGASAVYGSDAVGGVVNFILKRDYDGADTRVRYGAVTQGDSREIEANQTLGHTWGSGSGLLSYEYDDRSPLSAADRSYTDTATLPFTLLPQQRRTSLFGTINERPSNAIELFADGDYSQRAAYQALSIPTANYQIPSDNRTYGFTLGGQADLPQSYQLSLSTSYAGSSISDKYITNGANTSLKSAHTSVVSTDLVLNGPLFTTPSGPVLMAIGSQYRRENLNADDLYNGNPFLDSRNVIAGFTELSVPIIGPSEGVPGIDRLALIIADRYERYSDFGSTNNPKFGIVFSPDKYLKIRGTYGSSFRAPSLIDLNPVPSVAGAVLDYDPLTGTNRPVLALLGGNPNLQPERARTSSFGLDLSPDLVHGLKAGTTYYNIRYTNRIANAGTQYSAFDGLQLADTLGPGIVERNPSPAAISAIANLPNFINLTGIPGPLNLASIAAILNFNDQNISEVKTSGIDANISYETTFSRTTVETGVDATYILKFENQFTSTTPLSSVLNTPYNPVDLKLRAKWIVSQGDIRAGLFLNYVNSYTNNRVPVAVPIASWTTADLSLNYKFPSENAALHGADVSLNIRNIMDANPPYVQGVGNYSAISYDGTNANPLGRFISIQLRKQW
jgi:outer membrane receptor protein involved in Fe transport